MGLTFFSPRDLVDKDGFIILPDPPKIKLTLLHKVAVICFPETSDMVILQKEKKNISTATAGKIT